MLTILNKPIIYASYSVSNNTKKDSYSTPKIRIKDDEHQIKVDLSIKCQCVEEYCYLHADTDTCEKYRSLMNNICNVLNANKKYQQIFDEYDTYKIEHNKMLKIFSKLHILLDYYNMKEPDSKECVEFKELYNTYYKDINDLFQP